jgi:uracil-DNA glycosylase
MTKTELCEKCGLGFQCHKNQNNVKGWGNPQAKLVILLDWPGDHFAEKLLIWILQRLSLTEKDVWIDYVFKCQVTLQKPKKAWLLESYKTCWNHIIRQEVFNASSVVVAGNWGCEFVVEGKMKDKHGSKDEKREVWVCYSFKYLLMNPAECVDNWRVLFKAAEEAGLKPEMNLSVPAFDFPAKKLIG